MMKCFLSSWFLMGALWADVGPNYQRPDMVSPPHFKGVTWREARPAGLDSKGEWWRAFQDAQLNRLEARATAHNQELKGALARFDQARLTARMARSDFFPVVTAPQSYDRQRTSGNMPSAFPLNGLRYDGPAYNSLLDFSWEVDLWGKLRRAAQSDKASALAASDLVHHVLLGIQADVASHYFQIRTLDAEIRQVKAAVDWRRESLKIAQNRTVAGAGSELEQAQAQLETASAEAEMAPLKTQRDQLENALALLVGSAASEFNLSENSHDLGSPPAVPAAVPSDLLERRPDLSSAEQTLVAATAKIGVAKALFFPSLKLMANGGFQSGQMDLLFEPTSLMWSYGPRITLPIFAGGKTTFNLNRARAAHDEALAAYRQAYLGAIADVESSFSQIRHLRSQHESLRLARQSADKAADLVNTRYQAGTAPYLEVIEANRAALNAQRASTQVVGRRWLAAISLIKALGGGWTEERTLPITVADPAAQTRPESAPKSGFLRKLKKLLP
jgi:outer membrane protein, multidrug efflux system